MALAGPPYDDLAHHTRNLFGLEIVYPDLVRVGPRFQPRVRLQKRHVLARCHALVRAPSTVNEGWDCQIRSLDGLFPGRYCTEAKNVVLSIPNTQGVLT